MRFNLHPQPQSLGLALCWTQVSKRSLEALMASLSLLDALEVGIDRVGQVNEVRDWTPAGRLSLSARDPSAAPSEWGAFVTCCTLCMCNSLVSLRLGLIKMDDATFMIALGERVHSHLRACMA